MNITISPWLIKEFIKRLTKDKQLMPTPEEDWPLIGTPAKPVLMVNSIHVCIEEGKTYVKFAWNKNMVGYLELRKIDFSKGESLTLDFEDDTLLTMPVYIS